MKLVNYIPAILTLCIILGIITGYYLNPAANFVITLLLILLLFLAASQYFSNKGFKDRLYFNFISYLLFFVIGIASISFQNSNKYHYSHQIGNENKLKIIITKKLKSNLYYDKYFAQIAQLNNKKTKGVILVNIKLDSIKNNINIGDVYYVKSNFKKINKPLNPFQFNYQKYLEKQQIYHQITIKNKALLLLGKEKSINSYAASFRKKIIKSLKKNDIKNDELAIINALILGQRQDISKTLIQSYTNAGAIHILAVSGLHIGILMLLLNLIFKPVEFLKKGKLIKPFIVVVFLWLYAFLAGLSPSVIRAVTMFSAITLGGLFHKKTSTIHSLFISMFFLLLYNPFYVFSVGFQLSYLAVFSIVYFYPLFIKFYYPKNKIVRYFYNLFAISFAAQIGILPLSLYYFHQFPSLFFVSSLVIIPFLGVILGLGILVIFLALFDILPLTIAHIFSDIIHLMNSFIAFIAKQESFIIKNIIFSFLLLIASYFIIISIFKLWKKPAEIKIKAVFISIILFQVILLLEKYKLQTSNELIVFNQNKQSVILLRKGMQGKLFTNSEKFNTNIIKNYTIGTGNINLKNNKLTNILSFNNKTILLIDSLTIYEIPKVKIDYVVLQNSPKININRLITIVKPKLIIADGSNYKSYKKQWEKTCNQLNIKFHDTAIDGAFVFSH